MTKPNGFTERDVPFAQINCHRIHGIHKVSYYVVRTRRDHELFPHIDHLPYTFFRWLNSKNVSVRMHACIRNDGRNFMPTKQREITTHIAQLNRFYYYVERFCSLWPFHRISSVAQTEWPIAWKTIEHFVFALELCSTR